MVWGEILAWGRESLPGSWTTIQWHWRVCKDYGLARWWLLHLPGASVCLLAFQLCSLSCDAAQPVQIWAALSKISVWIVRINMSTPQEMLFLSLSTWGGGTVTLVWNSCGLRGLVYLVLGGCLRGWQLHYLSSETLSLGSAGSVLPSAILCSGIRNPSNPSDYRVSRSIQVWSDR